MECTPCWEQAHTKGKWKEQDGFLLTVYPRFPWGGGYIVSRPVAQYIATHSESLHNYQGEDAYMGLWLAESSMTDVRWNRSERIENEPARCRDETKLIIGHDISAHGMRQCYE